MGLLELQGVTKHYPGVTALGGVDFDVAAGTVHAVVGENGAGKSTLLRLIAGADAPDAGTIRWDGAPVRFASPRDALRRGITVIYQELALVPNLGADANIFLGIEPTRRGVLDRAHMTECAAEALHDLGLFIDPREPVGRLSVARQQLVELARALVRDARLVALDEPTAALTAHEVAHLMAQIERLREAGIGVIFVSHRLDEVRRVANTVTVLRDGHRVWVGPAAGLDEATLVRRMVGRDVAYERRPPSRAPETMPLLEVAGLTRAPGFRDVSLTLARGEIVGLAGLIGAGRTPLARAIAGLEPWDSGTVRLAGLPYRPRHPRDAIARGVVYLPEDRKRDAGAAALHARGPGASGLGRSGRAARGRRRGPAAARPRTPDAHPVGRQPAESGAREMAVDRRGGGVVRRADPRRGCGRQDRPAPPDPRPGGRGQGGARDLTAWGRRWPRSPWSRRSSCLGFSGSRTCPPFCCTSR